MAPADTVAAVTAGIAELVAAALDGPGRPGALGAPAAAGGLYLGDELLDPAATVRDAGIVSGVRVGFGGPVPPPPAASPGEAGPGAAPAGRAGDGGDDGVPDRPAGRERWYRERWYEVRVVGGPCAGRVWSVGPGAHGIGPGRGSAIRLPGVPEPGPVLHVSNTGVSWVSWPSGTEDRPGDPAEAGWPPRVAEPRPPVTRMTDEHRLAMAANQPGQPADAVGPATDPPRAAGPGGVPAAGPDLMAGSDQARPWPVNVDLAVGEHLLRLVDPFEPDAAVTASVDVVGRDFNRPPRIVPPLLYARQRFPTPPRPPSRRPVPIVLMLAPMLMGFAFFWFLGSVFFLVIMLFTPLMGFANWFSGRRGGRRQYRRETARYRSRRAETERELAATVAGERVARAQAAPDPAQVWLTATGPGGRLWERRRADPDYLVLRVGTADQPSLVEVEDPAVDGVSRDVRWIVPDLPVLVDVAAGGVVGLAGPRPEVAGLARWLVGQAAVLHSPRDLRVEVLTDAAGQACWDWLRWLPHARPGPADGPSAAVPYAFAGTDAETVAARVAELVALVRARTKARGSAMGQVLFQEPDVLVVLDGARRLRDVPGVVQVLTEGPQVRVFALCLETEQRLLPEECAVVVRADPDGLTVRRSDAPELTAVRQELVGQDWCDQVGRALCPLRDVTPEDDGGLPERVGLLEVLGLADVPPDELAGRIAAGWQARQASTAFPLGVGFDGPFVLDLVRDGPHALVAGTTGAGKSELLQTLVAALAAHNHPDELGFVLIDYKGGSAFHDCVRLPHTLGMVTDLDAALAARALESLAAELRRREEVLARVAAKDLAHYRALRAADPSLAPLGRLVIVIDEFATLVRDVPAFIPGLVSLAQRGRSLGVHLVLATQRPGGSVTADIRANTNLRIALRVTDTHESTDVIDTPDAAYVPAATPGRALVRLAARSSVPFQTAYAGGRYVPPAPDAGSAGAETTETVDLAGPAAPVDAVPLRWPGLGRPLPFAAERPAVTAADEDVTTDLDVLVEAIRAAAVLAGDDPAGADRPSPWLPPLGTRVLLDDLLARVAAGGGPGGGGGAG
ncbi:MAG: cell division protein FtsK, partial [Frankia sp.]|nr:cell division protein FtsK [Frankia sp.]